MKRLLTYWLLLCACVIAQPELTNTEATNIDTPAERQAWREALELWTDDSPTFTGGTYTGNLLIGGKLNVGNGALDDTHIVNFVSSEDVITEVMLHLEWNSPTPAAGDSNALLFSMYDSALNETEYSRFRSVIEDPTDGAEDGAMTVDVLNNGVLEQAVLFSHDEIIMNDNGADRNFIVKDNTTAEVLRIQGGNGSIAMDGSTLFVDSANNRVGVGTNTPSAGYALDVSGNTKITGYLDLDRTVDIYLGEIPSSPAYSGLWFSKNSSTATASNYSFLGDASNTFLNGPTNLYLRTGNTTRATIDADGIEVAAGDSISFSSNSGTWDGAIFAGNQSFTGNLTVDTLDLFVDASANHVGIGTNTPTTLSSRGLHLYDAGSAGFSLENSVNKWDHLVQNVTGKYGLYSSSISNYVFLAEPSGNFQLQSSTSLTFAANSGTWDGATISGNQSFSNDVTVTGDLTVDTDTLYVNSATDTVTVKQDLYSQATQLILNGFATFDGPAQTLSVTGGGIDTTNATISGNFALNASSLSGSAIQTTITNSNNHIPTSGAVNALAQNLFVNNQTWAGDQNFTGQVELTGQAASTDDSAMTKGLVRDFSSVWGDVYKAGNGETDTNNKLNMVYAGDRYFNFACFTGTAAGDGQWTTFNAQSFGLTYGSGAKGQLRDSFSYKFKFDSNTTTNTDVDLWLIRGKTANATLPVASDVCFALKFAGEEDLMIAVYDGVTAHTTTIDVSTINSWFTNLATQQEFMWTWDGTTAKVYGRYRKPAGTGDNDWSIWYTMGSLTPSGMSAGTTNLSFAGLHFLQHTPITNTGFTKNFIIWDLEHTSHVIAPN